MQFGVPSQSASVQVPILIKFGEQGKVALATCSPVAQLNLTKMDIELARAIVQQCVRRWRCRAPKGFFFLRGQLRAYGLSQQAMANQ